MNNNKYYKIVSVDESGQRHSWMAKHFKVLYNENEWAIPQVGKLWIFDTLNHAIEAIGIYSKYDTELWEVKAIEAEECNICAVHESEAESWWDYQKGNEFKPCNTWYSIDGSMVTSKVKLIKLIGKVTQDNWVSDLKRIRNLYEQNN